MREVINEVSIEVSTETPKTMLKIPRILIAAPSSGSGKTLFTCALLRLLQRKGIRAAAFKCGPDYIDPMFHRDVLGTPSRNLDLYLAGEEGVRRSLAAGFREANAEIAVIEGVMGYLDGTGESGLTGSSYHLAVSTHTPVILTVNARGMSRSAAALVKGFAEYGTDRQIKGLFLNRVSQPSAGMIANWIREDTDLPVLASLPQEKAITFTSRHLGLIEPGEIPDLQNRIDRRIEYVQNSPRMQLNATNAPTAICEIKISNVEKGTLKAEDFTMIKTAIYNEILFGDSLSPLAEQYGLSIVDLREMIGAKIPSVGSAIRIIVHNDTLESAEALREDLLKVIDSKHKDFAKAFGDYKFEVFNRSTGYAIDSDVVSYQDKQNEALSKLQTQAYTAQNQSTQLVKPTAVQQYSKKYMLKSGIKMGVIGLIGGCVLALAAVMFLMIQKGVIFHAEEIDGEYGLRKLADFSAGSKDNKNTIDYIIARLENYVGDRRDLKIGVTGLAGEARLQSLAADLGKAAGASGNSLRFVCLPDLMTNAASLRSLRDVDGVILAEEIGKSEYMKIRQEIALIADSEREILGTVYY